MQAKQNGVKPIIDTGLPYSNGLSADGDTLRKAYVAKVREIADYAKCGLLDSDALLSDNGSPAGITTAYSAGDGIHPNEAGLELKAQYAGPIIERVLKFGA